MKLKFDMKNKKADLETDVEKLIEKKMDLEDKNWKDKFEIKHNARKEILELKHKQKLESEVINQKKRNWIERMQDEKRKQKELELEEQRKQRELELQEQKRKETETKNRIRNKTISSVILGTIAIVIFSIGSILGSMSGNPDSGFYAMSICGLFIGLAIPFMWIPEKERMEREKEEQKKKHKTKR